MCYLLGPRDKPMFVVFEGVDGVGKSTLSLALFRYYMKHLPNIPTVHGSFPGSVAGSLGEWVYRLHHGQVTEIDPKSVAPGALQLLHIAAHVDGIRQWVRPALQTGNLILDRYWWSTYAYSRSFLSAEDAWTLVSAEFPFWQGLVSPTIVYIHRSASLKQHEIEQATFDGLHGYYQEIISRQVQAGVTVLVLPNDDSLEHCWMNLLRALELPEVELKDVYAE